MPTYTIHDLPQEDRPRERLRKVGVDNLSLQELLALIIERGKKNQNVLTIAQNLLAHFGNLTKIKEASIEELQEITGIGFATACKLQAAFKLGEKAQTRHKRYDQKIENPEDVFNLLKNRIGNKKKECFVILSLNSRNHLIHIDDVTVGSLNINAVHPREVFAPAIANRAAQIILAHNHPSGDPKPSKEDLKITKRLIDAGKIMGIGVSDHVTITKTGFLSLKRGGLI